MTLEIMDVKINDEQEKEIFKAGQDRGYIMLIINKDGAIRLSPEEEETIGDDDMDATTIDFTAEYYDHVLAWLRDNGIPVTEDIRETISKAKESEVEYERKRYQDAVKTAGMIMLRLADKIKEKVGKEMQADISAKQKNDYRAILRHISAGNYDVEYLKKWAGRMLGEETEKEYTDSIGKVKSDFGDDVLRYRMYNRLFIDDGVIIAGREGLKWIRLEKATA